MTCQETTVTTELTKSTYTFNWVITNWDIICPENSKEFEIMKSPIFTAGEDIGKKSRWFVHITGIAEHIACYLQLDTSGTENRGHRCQSVTCAFKINFGNSDNRFIFTRHIMPHKFTRENNDWGYAKFIGISELYEKKDTYLRDQTLHICVQMEIYGDPVNITSSLAAKRKRESTLEKFSTDFKGLLKPNKYSDVDIRCGTQRFHCHKLILSARSTVFNAMFESEMTESSKNEVVIEDMDPLIVSAMLKYIYTGKVDLPDSASYTELIYGAEKYDLTELKHCCFDKLLETVSDDNVGMLAVAAHTYSADKETRQTVKKYCQAHITSLMKIPSFKALLVKHSSAFFED